MARQDWGWNTRDRRHDDRAIRESEREHGGRGWSEASDYYGNRRQEGTWREPFDEGNARGAGSGQDLGTARSWYGDDRGERERDGEIPNFTGRGPRNWRRSDERIREDVNERLERHSRIDASDIDVEVRDGEVTLMGTVHDRQMKRLAEDVVEDVAGVAEVHNQIRIRRDGVLANLFGGGERSGSSPSRDDQ